MLTFTANKQGRHTLSKGCFLADRPRVQPLQLGLHHTAVARKPVCVCVCQVLGVVVTPV